LNQATASFLDQSSASFLDQATASFLDQSSASFLDQATASFLDQSTASFLDQSTASFLESNSAGHGHATMVAGIIAALAPDAMIMPLRAFDDSGTGDAFQVAKAIRYATQNGAHVINLSLGFSSDAAEVRAAINFATSRGVVVVASAGNAASAALQYPAALPNVIGVAATDLLDRKATFSNYGQSVVVDAPGVDIITAYPGGYAVASGTSFAAAFVSAEAALVRARTATGVGQAIKSSAQNIDGLNPSFAGQLGYGQINLLGAVSLPIQ
jgi:thermitase